MDRIYPSEQVNICSEYKAGFQIDMQTRQNRATAARLNTREIRQSKPLLPQ
jgi:hypothetical protein